ncbi:hypothetical protein D3C76_1423350 [compost metagenome]
MTNPASQHACINFADSYDAVFLEQIVYAVFRTPVAWRWLMTTHNETVYVWTNRLKVITRNTVVSDQRIRHGHDLTAIGRIRKHLLIACNSRIKNDLTCSFTFSTECFPGEQCAVFQQ